MSARPIIKIASAALSATLLLAAGATRAHEDEGKGQLGRVKFATSCNAKVQPLFETGVAMLHSFWYPQGLKAFEEVATTDANCAMASPRDAVPSMRPYSCAVALSKIIAPISFLIRAGST